MSLKKDLISHCKVCYFIMIVICEHFFFLLISSSQVKKSTLNPNAKEFNPIKPQMPMVSQFIPVKFLKCEKKNNN